MRAQYGLPCLHRPAMRDGEVWHGCPGPSQTYDVPSETPAIFLVVVLSRRMADGMTRVNSRASLPR
eukprot:2294105-Pyramimonas_sp.AAC.1